MFSEIKNTRFFMERSLDNRAPRPHGKQNPLALRFRQLQHRHVRRCRQNIPFQNHQAVGLRNPKLHGRSRRV